MTEHLGPQKTEVWLKGLVDNMARSPKGGDTDQIKGVASGECGVALTNSYYVARLLKSSQPDDRATMDKVRVVFPNQGTSGTHVNIAGAAVAGLRTALRPACTASPCACRTTPAPPASRRCAKRPSR